MTAIGTKLLTVGMLTSALVGGCKYFPEQVLLPGEPMTAQDSSSPRRSSATSPVDGAGRGAEPGAPQSMAGGSMAAASPAAGSGAASQPDAGDEPKNDAGAAMNTPMTSAGSSAMPAAGSGSEDPPKQAKDPTCDLTGVWIAKQLSASRALDEVGSSNGFAYFEIEQSGTEFVVTKHYDCGGIALGGGTAYLSRESLQALAQHNNQTGRTGRFELVDGKCTLDVARFWSLRGGDETRFLPDMRDSTMSMAELSSMRPLPTPSMPEGAEDWENDGELGVASQHTGLITGSRNGVQRDWDRWFTAPGYEVTPSMDFTTDITIRFEYEGEESVFAPTIGLLATKSEPAPEWDPVMRFRFLGRTTDDPRAQAFIKAEPVDTCYAVQDALPPEMVTP
jgi:hypothetical protein